MDGFDVNFMTKEEEKAMEIQEMSHLSPQGSPGGGPTRGRPPGGGPPGGGPSGGGSRGDTRDIRIPINELIEAPAAGPSSQGPGFGHAAAGDDSAAAAGDSDAHEDWRTRGLLNTVDKDDTVEIERLRGLVDTRLHMAVRAQDLTALCTLLADGASPAALDWEGRTPLHLCVVYRLMEPFKVLLGAPGAADVRDASGWPLLHATILHGWRDGARAALAAGARVDATSPGKIDIYHLSHSLERHPHKKKRYPDVDYLSFVNSLPRTAIEVAMEYDMAMLKPILSVAKDRGVIDCLTKRGHTALYTAILFHNTRAMETLLMYGASLYEVSDTKESALHAAIDHPEILKFLLKNTDVLCTFNEEGLTPEHLAVDKQKPESLKILLDEFKNTRVKTREGDTPLHLAANKEGDEMAKIILIRDSGAQAIFEVNAQGYTPLHLAAKNNNKELAALLLLNGGNLSTKTKNDDETTVLELISTNFYDSEFFLERLLDGFIYNTYTDDQKKVCLDYEVLTNGKDMSQIKALEEFVKCDQTKALIHPLIESLLYLKWKRVQPLFFALIRFYGIFLLLFNFLIFCIFYLEDKSNNSIKVKNSSNCCPTSDVEATRSNGFHGEGYWLVIVLTYVSMLTLIFQESTFVYLKRGRYFKSVESWVKMIVLVLCAGTPPLAALAPEPWPLLAACAALLLAWLQAMFRFYGILLSLFNLLIFCIFYLGQISNNIMTVNNSSNFSPTSDLEANRSKAFRGEEYWLLIVLTYVSMLPLIFQESTFVYLKRGRYFKSVESWVKLIVLVLCAGTPPLAALAPEPWPRHVACVALLLAWLQAMFLVSRFSRWGYYVLMFGKVAINILKILLTAVFLVIAFAFCFMIQYHSSPPFDDPFTAFVKTLVMMSSEFEYENLFSEAHDPHLQDTRTIVRLLFVTFVIFVAIVLMNFMIGVAVSDINDLNETGKIRRLEKQVELLSTFEPLACEGVLAELFMKLFDRFDKSYHSSMDTFRGNKSIWHVKALTHTELGGLKVPYTIQIRSSKLYKAIVETPSKQKLQDREAAKHNSEKPYRSQRNATHNEVANKPAGDEDLVRRKDNHFDSIIYKQLLSSLVNNSSKMKRDIEVLKQHNIDLNLQFSKLSAMSSDILRSIEAWSQLDGTHATRAAPAPPRHAQDQPTSG
ncbi:uncharacterized protein isoform X2 [Choristoneura fumiferana]|uniref:uncharacterized protein isoform X2 n=1 Tax=Choristoneura fumiferana TaxID=7141 RepID=UPI003D153AB1